MFDFLFSLRVLLSRLRARVFLRDLLLQCKWNTPK